MKRVILSVAIVLELTYQKGGVDVLNESYGRDESFATDPKASPAVRQFQSGLVMVYGFIVYNAQIDKGTGQPQLHMRKSDCFATVIWCLPERNCL